MSEENSPMPDNMMAAVEHSVKSLKETVASLQESAIESKTAATDAKLAADRAEKTAKRWRKLSILLGIVVAFLIGVSAVTGYFVNQTRNNTNGLREQSIQSCEIGNQRAAGTVAALDFLVGVLEGPNPTPTIKALAQRVEAQVLKDNKPRDCSQAYQPPSGVAVAP